MTNLILGTQELNSLSIGEIAEVMRLQKAIATVYASSDTFYANFSIPGKVCIGYPVALSVHSRLFQINRNHLETTLNQEAYELVLSPRAFQTKPGLVQATFHRTAQYPCKVNSELAPKTKMFSGRVRNCFPHSPKQFDEKLAEFFENYQEWQMFAKIGCATQIPSEFQSSVLASLDQENA